MNNILPFFITLFIICIIIIVLKLLYNLFGYSLFYIFGILQIIYHLFIVFIKGIKIEDFTKDKIMNMKPVGASSLIWLIVIMIILIGLYIFR